MAQTKRKRTRKHRGTPAGTIERGGRTGRPQTREDAKRVARVRRQDRLDQPPTRRGASHRAAIAAAFFAVLVVVLFSKSMAEGPALGAFMFLLYIPFGFAADRLIYSYRMKKKAAAR